MHEATIGGAESKTVLDRQGRKLGLGNLIGGKAWLLKQIGKDHTVPVSGFRYPSTRAIELFLDLFPGGRRWFRGVENPRV